MRQARRVWSGLLLPGDSFGQALPSSGVYAISGTGPQALYVSSDPSGVRWVKRGQIIRDTWFQVARQRIEQSENPSECNERIGPWSSG